MSQKRVLPEDERRELRIWMRRKQRENLAVYQKHRESLREREHKPFPNSGALKSTKKNEATNWRTREEKEKFELLKRFNQRAREACALVSDIPSSTVTLRTASQTGGLPVLFSTRPNSAPAPGSTHRAHSVSANDKVSLKSGQSQPPVRPWTAENQERYSEDWRRRLGLHRPVTSLPKDRLSQVTRRGMLTHTKSNTKLPTVSQSEERPVGQQRKTGPNKGPSRGLAVGRGILREQTRREEENLRGPTSQTNRLLENEESDMVLAGLVDEQENGATAGDFAMDWLDNLSESAGSTLSKIDWAAIERMVAAENA